MDTCDGWSIACVEGGSSGCKKTRAREKETREGRAPSPLVRLPHARPFSLVPTTSKRLLRRLGGQTDNRKDMSYQPFLKPQMWPTWIFSQQYQNIPKLIG